MAKREAPDEPPIGKTLNISIDLGDEKQVERAHRLGLLSLFSDNGDDDTEGQDGDGEVEVEEGPKRRGYFSDSQ